MSLSRRKLLKKLTRASALSLSSPLWLNALLGDRLLAQGSEAAPLRLITLYNRFGTVNRFWRPRSLTGSYDKKNWTLDFDRSILLPLQAFKDKVTILDGIDYKACYTNSITGHEAGIASSLTGARMETAYTHMPADITKGSIDQYVASVIGNGTPIKSLALAAGYSGGTNVYDTTCYAAGGIKIPPIRDPRSIYSLLVNNTRSLDGSVAASSLIRQSAVDFALADINLIKNKIDPARRQLLEINADALRAIEASFENLTQCTLGQSPEFIDFTSRENVDQLIDLQFDLLVQAFHCQVTNVANFSFNLERIPFINGLNIDVHNDITHKLSSLETDDPNPIGLESSMIDYHNYMAQKVAYLMSRLDERQDVDGKSLLDNTLILWVNELGYAGLHGNMNVPWVLAGGAGGKLDMGSWYQFSTDPNWDCTYYFAEQKCGPNDDPLTFHMPHNNALVSVLGAFGIPDTHFGFEGIKGGIAGLNF